MLHSQRTFREIYEGIDRWIEYNPKWLDHSDHFHKACEGPHAVDLKPGERAKSEATYPDCRRIILVGTFVGPMVIYERLRVGHKGLRSQFICQGVNPRMRKFPKVVVPGSMTSAEIIKLVGRHDFDDNVGKQIARVLGQHAL